MPPKDARRHPSAAWKLKILISPWALALLAARLAIAQTVLSAWEPHNTTSIMDDKTTFEAVASARTHDGQQDGLFKVSATCRTVSGNNTAYREGRQVQVPFNSRSISFLIVFLSDKPGILFAHGKRLTLFDKYSVPLRVRIDSEKPETRLSIEDYANYAHVDFSTRQGGTEGDGPDNDGKLIHAQRVLIELTTENDVIHILEINPGDPSFQRFVSGCGYNLLPPAAQPPRPTATALALNNAFLGPPEKRDARTYRGNLDGFVAALPAYIQKAAAGIGAPPRSYDYEVRYIAQAVQQCAGITAEQAASVTFHNVIDVSKLGAAYRNCAAPYGVPVPKQEGPLDRSHPAELLVMIRPVRLWGDGNGVSVIVGFTEIGFPGARSGQGQSCAIGLDCGIVHGFIQGANGVSR